MQAKPQKDYQKLQRNTEKLSAAEMAFDAINAEVKARMTALLTERWDFINVRRISVTPSLHTWTDGAYSRHRARHTLTLGSSAAARC